MIYIKIGVEWITIVFFMGRIVLFWEIYFINSVFYSMKEFSIDKLTMVSSSVIIISLAGEENIFTMWDSWKKISYLPCVCWWYHRGGLWLCIGLMLYPTCCTSNLRTEFNIFWVANGLGFELSYLCRKVPKGYIFVFWEACWLWWEGSPTLAKLLASGLYNKWVC